MLENAPILETPPAKRMHRLAPLAALLWMVAQGAWGQSFVLDIGVGPELAGTMPTYEVAFVDDVDAIDLYRFARDRERRAGVLTGSDWALTHVSLDDVLSCTYEEGLGSLEMDLDTLARGAPVFWNEQARESLTAHFESEPALELRARFGDPSQSWSPWMGDELSHDLPVPDAGEESSWHFDLELRTDANSTVFAMSGYIKIKKLNSGD